MRFALPLLGTALLATACAMQNGVVALDGGRFVIVKEQAYGFADPQVMKTEVSAQAARHCVDMGKEMELLSLTATEPPYILGNFPRARIEFTCGAAKAATTKP
jgi:hypothetical protein